MAWPVRPKCEMASSHAEVSAEYCAPELAVQKRVLSKVKNPTKSLKRLSVLLRQHALSEGAELSSLMSFVPMSHETGES